MKAKDILIFFGLVLVIALIFVGIKFSGILSNNIPEEEFLEVGDSTAVVEVNGDEYGERAENTVQNTTVENTVVEEPEVVDIKPEEPQVEPQGKVDQFAGGTDHGINATVSIDQKMEYSGMEIYYYKNQRDNYVLTIKKGDEVNEIAEAMATAFAERVGSKLYYFKDMDGRCTFYTYDLNKKEETNLEIPIDVKVVGMNSYDSKVLLKVENYSEVEGGSAEIEYNVTANSYEVVNN